MHVPPPAIQRSFSAPATHENAVVMAGIFESAAGVVEGWQVATVRLSMNRRTKKRGNVPPRLDNLFIVSIYTGGELEEKNLRCKQGHISAAIYGISNDCVECRYSDKHDRIHESREHMSNDDEHKEARSNTSGREDVYDELGE
jgi:hypothetical protein